MQSGRWQPPAPGEQSQGCKTPSVYSVSLRLSSEDTMIVDPAVAYRTRIREALLRSEQRTEPGWSVPSEAGGSDDWDPAVDAFARHVNVEPSVLPAKARREWSRVLARVGATWGATPKVLESVIGQIAASEFHWKTYATPHQAEADLGTLVGQHLSGGIKRANGKADPRTNGDKLAEALARIEGRDGDVIEAEYEVY